MAIKASDHFKTYLNPSGPTNTTLTGIHRIADIAAAVRAKGGKAYAYRDAAGNYYELNFGLRF